MRIPRAFSRGSVKEVFYESFNGDIGRFAGKQRGYLEDACEFIYRIMQDAENKQIKDYCPAES
jgi:hypothetical protein